MKTDSAVNDSHLRAILDAMPMPVFVMDNDLVIVYTNKEAERFLQNSEDVVLRKLCGEALHCLHALESEKGCGFNKHCPDCIIRQAVDIACQGQRIYRKKYKMQLQRNNATEQVHLLVTSAPFSIKEEKFSLLILENITELDELRKLVPICSGCKKVRQDGKYWQDVEWYIQQSLDVDLTHGLCPDCIERLYPDLFHNKS